MMTKPATPLMQARAEVREEVAALGKGTQPDARTGVNFGADLGANLVTNLGIWPAALMVALVLGAAVFAFSPRPIPAFPPTTVGFDQLLIDGVVRIGWRWLAVGEQGRILLADNVAGPWRSATVEPQRGSTFTQVLVIDAQLALAVGHDSWIVRSEDGGQSWREVNFNAELSEPLLGIAGPFDGKIFAFGGFGQMLVSGDLGKSWQPQVIETAAPAAAPAKAAASNAEPSANANVDPFAGDPFGAGAPADEGSDRHFNAMVQLADGALLLVGEKGLLMKSKDHGASWQLLPSIYKGSFFGALPLPANGVLVFGMRGHAFVSHDDAKTWTASVLPVQGSLFGGAVTADGSLYLVGDSNTVLVSKDSGAHFSLAARDEAVAAAAGSRGVLASVLPVGADTLLTAGENGLRLQKLSPDGSVSERGAPP